MVAAAFAQLPNAAVRINCGGPAYTDTQGQGWSADKNFVRGSAKNFGSVAVSNTADPQR